MYLAVHLLVNSFLSLVDGSNMFCHVALQDKDCNIMRSPDIKETQVVISHFARNLLNCNYLFFTFLENILLQ